MTWFAIDARGRGDKRLILPTFAVDAGKTSQTRKESAGQTVVTSVGLQGSFHLARLAHLAVRLSAGALELARKAGLALDGGRDVGVGASEAILTHQLTQLVLKPTLFAVVA